MYSDTSDSNVHISNIWSVHRLVLTEIGSVTLSASDPIFDILTVRYYQTAAPRAVLVRCTRTGVYWIVEMTRMHPVNLEQYDSSTRTYTVLVHIALP